MKRVGQALETKIIVDKIFDAAPEAKIIVCGDFNAAPGEVPVEAICGRIENTDNPDQVVANDRPNSFAFSKAAGSPIRAPASGGVFGKRHD